MVFHLRLLLQCYASYHIGTEHPPPVNTEVEFMLLCLMFHKPIHWHWVQDSCFSFCDWRPSINKLIELLPWPTKWITMLHMASRTSDTCPPDLQNGWRTGTEAQIRFPRTLKVSQCSREEHVSESRQAKKILHKPLSKGIYSLLWPLCLRWE